MELVPVPPGFLEQVPAGQGPQELPRLADRGIEQGRSRRGVDVLARVQAEQPERPGPAPGRAPGRTGEHGADLGGLLLGGQDVQPAAFGGQLGQQARGVRVGEGSFISGGPGDQGERRGRASAQPIPLPAKARASASYKAARTAS